MNPRPLINKNIAALEEMFAEFQHDALILNRLKKELRHRKRARASVLLQQVEMTLAVLEQGSPLEAPNAADSTLLAESAPQEAMEQPADSTGRISISASPPQDEALQILGVTLGAAWEKIEHARRTIVELSRPDLVSELDQGGRNKAIAAAQQANQAYAVLLEARLCRFDAPADQE